MTPGRRGLVRLLRSSLKKEQPVSESHRASYATGTPLPPAGGTASPKAPPQVVPRTSSTAAGGAKPQAPPAGGSGPGGASEPKKGGPDIFTLIPAIGLPGLGIFYAYQVYLQMEHDDRIAAVHDSIRQAQQQAQAPFNTKKLPATAAEVKQAALESARSKEPPSSNPPPAPQTPPLSPPANSQSASAPQATTSKLDAAPVAPAAEVPTPATAAAVATAAATAGAAVGAAAAAGAAASAAGPTTSIQDAAEEVLGVIATAGKEASMASPEPQAQAHATAAETQTPTEASIPDAAAAPVPSPAALAHAAKAGYAPVLSTPHEQEVAPIKKGTLGVGLDLTPSGLIQFAIERGAGPGEDWSAFVARHKQAVSDAELLGRAAQQIQSWHEAEVAGLKKEAEEHAKRAEEILKLAKANAESFKKLLRQHQEMAAELRQMEVIQAEKRTALAANKAQDAERVERSQVLDKLRLEVGALASAHEARTAQQATSLLSHSVTLAVLALDAALDSGRPLKSHLTELLQAAMTAEAHATPAAVEAGLSDASLVKASVESIPDDAASRGIPTVEELGHRLRGMKQAATALAMLPEPSTHHGSGGILAHAAAKIFAWLKADESSVVQALGPDSAVTQGGFPSALAAAEHYLSQGRLAEAAHVLSHGAKGTAAAAGVAGWVADVQSRAKADQALKLLRAHAGVLAAAVS